MDRNIRSYIAQTDHLTGASTRRSFCLELEKEIAQHKRSNTPAAVLLLDIDHFKRINDIHGHSAGDLVLQTVAERLGNQLRPSDVLGRLGGEEFGILLLGPEQTAAANIAKRFRALLESLAVVHDPPLHVTAGFGVAMVGPGSLSPKQWIANADNALYAAKRGGRNRCCLAASHEELVQQQLWRFAGSSLRITSTVKDRAYSKFTMGWLAGALLLLLVQVGVAQVSAPSAPAPQLTLAQAESALNEGQTAEAITALTKLRAADPTAKGVDHLLGLAWYRTGKLSQAQQAFAAAIASDPSDMESVQMEGLTLYRMGRPAAAIPYLQRVQQWLPQADADATHVLGLCYMNAQRFDDARKAFASEYNLPPNSGAAYLVLARLLLVANLAGKAQEEAQQALKLTPTLPLAHFLLGQAALFHSDLAQAASEFEAERAIDPSYPPVYERLGDVYFRLGRYQDAEQSLLKAIELDTSSTGPFLLMGQVLLRRGNLPQAAMYLEHAEKMDPSNFLLHTQLAQVYRRLGQPAKAQSEMDIANRIHVSAEIKLENIR
jgi:diguanylate cyclase (GGDEF)-like protein